MTATERGFLLLSSHLGNPDRPVLTTPQLRTLALRVKQSEWGDTERELTESDLVKLGYSREMARRMVSLLGETELLDYYLGRGTRLGCIPLTRVSDRYPLLLRQRLGLDSPGCLWAKGDLSILNTSAISLVGSRELRQENREFAEALGRHAAAQGLTLVSGNARGADKAAQEACLGSGGRVISIVADELRRHLPRENVLFLSEEDFDAPFSAQRALSRNRCIHTLGQMVFVAQSDLEKGGTWYGTAKNLHYGWSPVACFRDESPASQELEQMGAYLIGLEDLQEFNRFME